MRVRGSSMTKFSLCEDEEIYRPFLIRSGQQEGLEFKY
jgi:hypothetical protein